MTEVEHDGLVRALMIFNREAVIAFSTEALSEVLVTKSYVFEKPMYIRNYLASILGWSVLTTEGDEHKRQRRSLNPAFSFRHIKNLYPTFWDKAREVTLAMNASCHQQGFNEQGRAALDVGNWASRCTLDIVGLAGVGQKFGAIEDDTNALIKSYETLNPTEDDSLLIALRMFLPESIMRILPLRRLREIDEASQHIRSVCRRVLREKRRKIKDDGAGMQDKDDLTTDTLTVALASGMSDELLVDQMVTLISAGHDTTAASLTWAIYLLCCFPRVQTCLRDEIRTSLPPLGSSDAPVTSQQIDRMPYLNAVCNEVLRLYSPISQTQRVATQDTTIQGQFIPRGTTIVVPLAATNVDTALWGPDAGEFKPERWMPPSRHAASGGAESNYAFLTFIHGPRHCIGASFAKAELACLLAAWIGHFEFRLQDEALLQPKNMLVHVGVVMKPAGGLRVLVNVVD